MIRIPLVSVSGTPMMRRDPSLVECGSKLFILEHASLSCGVLDLGGGRRRAAADGFCLGSCWLRQPAHQHMPNARSGRRARHCPADHLYPTARLGTPFPCARTPTYQLNAAASFSVSIATVVSYSAYRVFSSVATPRRRLRTVAWLYCSVSPGGSVPVY